jgi:hypothetical protein
VKNRTVGRRTVGRQTVGRQTVSSQTALSQTGLGQVLGQIQLDRATDWILLVAALITSIVVFNFLVRVLRATISAAITLALVALILYFGLGVSPIDLFQELLHWLQRVAQRVEFPQILN